MSRTAADGPARRRSRPLNAPMTVRSWGSDHYQAEIDFLGIARSPAYHYESETTAASISSRRRCCGSSASTPSPSYARASASSPPTSTSSGCSKARLAHPTPSVPDAPSCRHGHVHRLHQPGVRSTEPGAPGRNPEVHRRPTRARRSAATQCAAGYGDRREGRCLARGARRGSTRLRVAGEPRRTLTLAIGSALA